MIVYERKDREWEIGKEQERVRKEIGEPNWINERKIERSNER